MAINEDYLYILKRDNSGRFVAEEYPINKDKTYYDFPINIKKEEFHLILKRRLGIENDLYFNYTSVISSSFVNGASFNVEKYSDGKYWAKNFLDAYYIEQAYNKCINDKQIKAYSHRKIGWNLHNFVLDDVFTILVGTNFGYGYANYFLLTLKFKNVEIIPFSHLVIYRIANIMQIIRNTRDYHIRDESWKECFDFVCNACNDFYDKGQDGFIRKYMIDELEKMTTELTHFLTTDTFELRQFYDRNKSWNEQKSEQVILSGYALTIFRGEKIAGAVQFVESINKLSEITPTQKYLDRITNCCNRVIPEMKSALNKLDLEISNAEIPKEYEHKKLLKLEKALNDVNKSKEKEDEKIERWLVKLKEKNYKVYNHIVSIKNEMRAKYYNNSNISSKYSKHTKHLLNKILKQTCLKWIDACSNYYRLKRKYENQGKNYREAYNKWHQLQTYQTTLLQYLQEMDKYLISIRTKK